MKYECKCCGLMYEAKDLTCQAMNDDRSVEEGNSWVLCIPCCFDGHIAQDMCPRLA